MAEKREECSLETLELCTRLAGVWAMPLMEEGRDKEVRLFCWEAAQLQGNRREDSHMSGGEGEKEEEEEEGVVVVVGAKVEEEEREEGQGKVSFGVTADLLAVTHEGKTPVYLSGVFVSTFLFRVI